MCDDAHRTPGRQFLVCCQWGVSQPMTTTSSSSPTSGRQRTAIFLDNRAHAEFGSAGDQLIRLVAASSAEDVDAQLAGGPVSAVIAHERAITDEFLKVIGRLRDERPDVEVLCCADDISVLDRLSRDFDGFVMYTGDPGAFRDSIKLVLDRCCARRNHGRHACKHTRAGHAAD